MRCRRNDGFTLIELLITTLILVVVLGAASTLFVNLMRAYKQQAKVSEARMEGIIGLEILRQDIQHGGFGLPWNGVTAAGEASAGANATACNPGAFTQPPRAFGSLLSADFLGSDYFVVRAANVGMGTSSRKWTTLRLGPETRSWASPLDDLNSSDRVIVLSPGLDNATFRTLVTNGALISTTFGNLAAFAPPDTGQTYVVYGIDDNGALRMPFNRADYSIDNASVPVHCAPNTGVLVKRVVRHLDGTLSDPYPLLDCVASVKYRYQLDTNGDGMIDTTADAGGLAGRTAAQIRDQVKEVQVFVLAHEGQRDAAYTHPVSAINVAGTNVNVDTHYRWRLFTMTVQPISLRD